MFWPRVVVILFLEHLSVRFTFDLKEAIAELGEEVDQMSLALGDLKLEGLQAFSHSLDSGKGHLSSSEHSVEVLLSRRQGIVLLLLQLSSKLSVCFFLTSSFVAELL